MRHTYVDRTVPERIDKHALALLCVLATYMVAKTRLPGPRAFRRSRTLAKTLETSLETFASVSGLMKGNDELAKFSRVRKIMDVSHAFTDERARTFRGEDHDEADEADEDERSSVVVDSLVTIDEAIRELDAMREGTVGLHVGRTFGEAFLRRGDAYVCVSHEANDGWSIRKGCSGKSLVRRAEEQDAEIVILETVV